MRLFISTHSRTLWVRNWLLFIASWMVAGVSAYADNGSNLTPQQRMQNTKFLHWESVRDKARADNDKFSQAPKSAVLKSALTVVKTLPMDYVADGIVDLGFGLGYLWGIDGVFVDDYFIDKISTTDGSVVSHFAEPTGSYPTGSSGLTFANSYLWILNYVDDLIYKIDPSTGNKLGSISAPAAEVTLGLGSDGTYLWYGIWDYYEVNDGAILKKITTTGTTVDSFHLPGVKVILDVAVANNELWVTVGGYGNTFYRLYRINPDTHSIIEQFDRNPCAWGTAFDGTNLLWLADWCKYTLTAYDFDTPPPPTYVLTVKTDPSLGTVTSNPAGINCGNTCTANFNSGTSVTLTATPISPATFIGWSGACSGTATTCAVTMNAAKTVTAGFDYLPHTLTVSVTGTGTGKVNSTPAGINNCTGQCSASFAHNSTVSLKADANSGSTFGSWSGACTGTTNPCVVTMTAAKTTTATFNLVGGQADFTITGITLNPNAPVTGDNFNAVITVKNQGTANGDGGQLRLWINQATTQQTCAATGGDKNVAVGTLAAGASKNVVVAGLVAGVRGDKVLRALVDSTCVTSEIIETNNQAAKTYRVANLPGLPDLVVTAITLTPATPAANGTFSAAVTVKNQGTVADGGYLDVWVHQPATQRCGAEGNAWADVGVLAAGASKTLSVTGLAAGIAGAKTVRAIVDSWCETTETNEINNQLTKTYSVQ